MPNAYLPTNAQIRSTLTTSESNLPDEVLDDYGLDDILSENLDKLVVGWQTASTERAERLLRLYSRYFCAGTVAITAQVFILKKETDGSNEGQRSDKDGFAFLAQAMFNQAGAYLSELLDEMGLPQPEAVVPVLFSRSIPDRDPIVEPRSNVS